MGIFSSKDKQMPDLNDWWILGLVIFLISNTLGVLVIGVFNKFNPWIICEWPASVSFLALTGLTIWLRRTYRNLKF